MPQLYIKKILAARVYDVAMETPIHQAPFLSKRILNRVYLKREDLQPVFSFKIRGAYNKISQLSDREKRVGIITASAGNHAQGVALSAQKLGINATIVMPVTTPDIKVRAVKKFGSEVILQGDTFDEALSFSRQLVKAKGYTYIHPYDDPDTIAGQGTIAVEILRQHSDDLHAIFVPVGGGGLAAGISTYIKYLRPDIKVIGVECDDSACLKAALSQGERVTLPQVGLFADGVAVAQIGEKTFELCQKYLDDVVTVGVDEICAAIKDIFDDTRSVCEPAGALAVAGLKKYVEQHQIEQQSLLAIASGANINFDRLRYVSEQAELGEQQEAILAITIPEQVGSFKQFCEVLGSRSITEFNYRFHNIKAAKLFIGVQIHPDHAPKHQLITELCNKGYTVEDLTDNDMAKLHVRHMIGGYSTPQPPSHEERLYCFEFPERPCALLNFLNKLDNRFNITLFHYRNHGAAYGKVAVGLNVPVSEQAHMQKYLDDIGYTYQEETDNIAYRTFLT